MALLSLVVSVLWSVCPVCFGVFQRKSYTLIQESEDIYNTHDRSNVGLDTFSMEFFFSFFSFFSQSRTSLQFFYSGQPDLLLVGRLPTVRSHPLVASRTAA
jgi:hypothetical protein